MNNNAMLVGIKIANRILSVGLPTPERHTVRGIIPL